MRLLHIITIMCCILLPMGSYAGTPNGLVKYRLGFPEPGVARCVFDFQYPIDDYHVESKAGKVLVSIPHAFWDVGEVPSIPARHGLKALQHQSVKDSVQLTLTLNPTMAVKRSFTLPKNAEGHYRLVIDLAPGAANTKTPPVIVAKQAPAPVTPKPTAPTLAPAAPTPPTPTMAPSVHLGDQEAVIAAEWKQKKEAPAVQKPVEEASTAKAQPKPVLRSSLRRPLIVIDPGHGGEDPGTISSSKQHHEKDIALQYALALKKSLEATGKYDVILTRARDVFVPVASRVRRSRVARGDLFISLHADANSDPLMRGISIYTLSEQASDDLSAKLAAAENRESMIHGTQLEGEYGEIHDVLVDMVRRETDNSSIRFAKAMLVELEHKNLDIVPRGHRFANFLVLKGVDVPAVLIELGFLSNPEEETLLFSKTHREKIVGAIQSAVDKHFGVVSPPKGA